MLEVVVFNSRKKMNSSVYSTYRQGAILPILTANDLLGSIRYQGLVKQLEMTVKIPDGDFSRYYLPTINCLAEFVQLIPSQRKGPLGGLLGEGLSRAILAVHYYMDDRPDEDISPLQFFAVTTAALFVDIGNLVCNQMVTLVTETGDFIREWDPFSGAMSLNDAGHYRMFERYSSYQRLQGSINVMLARQLLTEDAFLWISSDISIFAEWLDVLSGYSRRYGSLGRALSNIRYDDLLDIIDALGQRTEDQLVAEANIHGEDFFNWLKDGIENNTIKVNDKDALVHKVDEGLLIEKALFKQYLESSSLVLNSHALLVEFATFMGYTVEGRMDLANKQYVSKDASRFIHEGKKTNTNILENAKKNVRYGMVVDPSRASIILSEAVSKSKILVSKERSSRLEATRKKQQIKRQVSEQASFSPDSKKK